MEITDELIEHLENLSKLKLKDSEKQKMKIDMNEILEYMKLLTGSDRRSGIIIKCSHKEL